MRFNSPMKKSRFDQAASGATVMTTAAICASHAVTTTTTITSAARMTNMNAFQAAAAYLGVLAPHNARIRTPRL